MSTKPVDVFMTGEPVSANCPISVAAIFGGMLMGIFQEMDGQDLLRWPDIGYTGFIGEIGDVMVILDAGPDSIVATVHDGEEGLWQIEITGEFLPCQRLPS